MTAQEHNKIAGILLLAHGGLQAVVMIFICAFYAIVGSAIFIGGTEEGSQVVGAAFIGMIFLVAVIATVFIVPQLIGGYMMLRERPSARLWGIAGSILSAISFPIGTAIGVYGLWFHFGEVGRSYYLPGGALPRQMQDPRAMEPHRWK